jgi:PAS domain S-box-containing protein
MFAKHGVCGYRSGGAVASTVHSLADRREVRMTEGRALHDGSVDPAVGLKGPVVRYLSRVAAFIVLALTAVILIGGWWLDHPDLRTMTLRAASMTPNTGLALMFGAASLLILADGANGARTIVGRCCAVIPFAIGVITLAEYTTGRSFGIDEPFASMLNETAAARASLRSWIVTSLGLVALATALFTLDLPSRRGWRVADGCAVCAGLLAGAGCVGYLIEGPAAVAPDQYVTMSLPTAASILLLAIGLLTARPDTGLFGDVRRRQNDGAASPRLWIAGFVIALLLAGYSVSLAWIYTARERATSEWVIRSYALEGGITGLLSLLQDVEDGARGYVIVGDPAYLDVFERGVATAADQLQRVQQLTADDQQRARLAALSPLIAERIAIARRIVDLRQHTGIEAARQAIVEGSGKRVMDEIRAAIGELLSRQNLSLNQRASAARREGKIVPVLIAIGAAGGATTLVLVFLIMLRENRYRRHAESRLDRFFSASLDLLCITGVDGYFKRLNPAFGALLGYTTKELMARPFMDFIHPEDQAATLAQVGKLATGEPMLSFENRYRCKSGGYKWLAWKSQPDLSEGLRYATARDITEQKIAEAALRRSRAQLQSLFESLPGLYLILTPDFEIVTASDAYLKATMLTREAMIGRGLFEVFPDNPDDTTASGESNLRASLERVRASRAADTMAIQKYDIRRPGGEFEERFWSPVNSPLLGPEGQLEFFIHRVEDVTEFVRHRALPAGDAAELRIRLQGMEAEIFQSAGRLQTAKRQLEAANKDLEAFTYSVSHDLRAPLRHVQGYVEMLTREIGMAGLSAKAQHQLKTITDAAGEMNKLIDDLLAFSRVGQMALRTDRVHLGSLVNDAILGLEVAVQGRRIDWKIAALPDVQGDLPALKHVFSNLLGNAVKYTRSRELANIEIGCAGTEEGFAILYVRDNGVGFDMQYANKLFGVFQRLHRAEEFEGTGIGLAIVRQVITRHHGRVWADAKLNEGATIYFTLRMATEESAKGGGAHVFAETHPGS